MTRRGGRGGAGLGEVWRGGAGWPRRGEARFDGTRHGWAVTTGQDAVRLGAAGCGKTRQGEAGSLVVEVIGPPPDGPVAGVLSVLARGISMTFVTRLGVVLLALIVAACGDTVINIPSPSPVDTPNPIPVVTKDKIQFVVTGNAVSVKVKYSSSVEGLNQTTTTLPFQSTISSSADGTFLFLEATPSGYSALVVNPFVAVQIFVNGSLFREAATTSAFNETVSVSGTYRR